jgi:hypothetical protein
LYFAASELWLRRRHGGSLPRAMSKMKKTVLDYKMREDMHPSSEDQISMKAI